MVEKASTALLVVVLGPTGSGKTALSIAVAQQFRGEVLNCDSVAMYREFEIGTAKPSLTERKQVSHHLFDFVHPLAYMTAGEYARRGRQVLTAIKARGHLPIVVGGTGLYLRALLEGLFPGPQRSDEIRVKLREKLGARGSQYLHRVLARLDPEAAVKVHRNDAPKLVRAIEVCLTARKPMTELWKTGRTALEGFRILRIGLEPARDALYDRINERARLMFESGLVDETKALLVKYGEGARPLCSLGYKQVVRYLHGEISCDQAIIEAQQAHRNYAKRQMTWFRREPDVRWLSGFGDDLQIQKHVASLISDCQCTDTP